MQTQNNHSPLQTIRSHKSSASQSVQNRTFATLGSLINMCGADLSVYSH